jgi:hypothetical protein
METDSTCQHFTVGARRFFPCTLAQVRAGATRGANFAQLAANASLAATVGRVFRRPRTTPTSAAANLAGFSALPARK